MFPYNENTALLDLNHNAPPFGKAHPKLAIGGWAVTDVRGPMPPAAATPQNANQPLDARPIGAIARGQSGTAIRPTLVQACRLPQSSDRGRSRFLSTATPDAPPPQR